MSMNLVNQLTEELSSFDIACSEEQAALLIKHLELVTEKNKTVNLTRITEPSEAVTLHVVDSLLPLCSERMLLDERTTFLDMGTGAGFPGIPLAIMSGSRATLVDSVGKKVTAVAEFAQELGLESVTAVHARLEELAVRMHASQDYVFARAVARTNVLIEYATPFLRKNGILVVEKGRPDTEELAEASRAASLCGMRLIEQSSFELPRNLGHREVLLYQKTGKAKIKLPRRTGLAKHDPLGVSK